MSTEQSKKTVVVDFDATLANYESWEVNGATPGSPREDVVNGLRRLKDVGWTVGILSTRNNKTIQDWLARHDLLSLVDFINENPDQPENCSHKPIAFIYIDDRAARYNGENMGEIVDYILEGNMEPWYKL